MSDGKIQSVLRFVHWKQDVVLKAKTTKKIMEGYCLFIMELFTCILKSPNKRNLPCLLCCSPCNELYHLGMPRMDGHLAYKIKPSVYELWPKLTLKSVHSQVPNLYSCDFVIFKSSLYMIAIPPPDLIGHGEGKDFHIL